MAERAKRPSQALAPQEFSQELNQARSTLAATALAIPQDNETVNVDLPLPTSSPNFPNSCP